MTFNTVKIKRHFRLGALTELEYFNKRLDIALYERFKHRMGDVFDRFTKTQIGIRCSEKRAIADHGESIIDAIMGKSNCLILINCMGGWKVVWQGRLQVSDFQESYETLSVYKEAIAAGASVHCFSTVLNEL